MSRKTIIEDNIDVLVVGGGLGGSGAAWEARFWGQDKKIIVAEKANILRFCNSGGYIVVAGYAITKYE